MGSMLIDLISQICDDPAVGITKPQTLFGAYDEGDTSDRHLLRALTKTCRHIAARQDWQVLRRTHTFTTVNAEIQTSGLPLDLLRTVKGTFYLAGQPVCGPLNDQEYSAAKAGNLSQPGPSFRIEGDQLLIYPAPAAGQSATYRYIRNSIGTKPGENPGDPRIPIASPTTDHDTFYWEDELLVLGTIMNWRKGQRLDYATDMAEFELHMSEVFKEDGGSRIISMGSDRGHGIRPSVTMINPGPVGNNT